MLVDRTADIIDLLACPLCHGEIEAMADGRLRCTNPECSHHVEAFPRLAGKDVLVDFDESVLDRDTTLASNASSVVGRGRWRQVLSQIVDGTNKHAKTYATLMVEGMTREQDDGLPVIAIFGAGEPGYGSHDLYTSPAIRAVSFDIYATPDITFVADGHSVPLRDGSVDAVWIQGILEVVVDPRKVVAEAARVLKPGGLMFTDTAFMWPLCEGRYDFNRWSMSGLRWLFRDFDITSSGQSTGPGTMVVLGIRFLMQSLLRSNKLGQIAAFPFVWLRFLDRLCDDRRSLDASVGMFLFGRKRAAPIGIEELLAYYDEQPIHKRAVGKLANDPGRRAALLAMSGSPIK